MFSLLKISVSIILIFISFDASGTDPFRPVTGAAEAGMGYSCIAKPGFWSSFHNQALLPATRLLSFGFSYDDRFGIKEMGSRYAALTVPAGKAMLGAVYSHFGYPDFRREMAGLACGLKLSEIISAGVMIDYFSLKTAGEYSNSGSVTFEAGLFIRASENVTAGIHLFNPVPNSIRKTNLPSRLRGGAGINLGSSLYAGAEAEMSTGSIPVLRTGFEYNAAKKVWIRGGFSTSYNSFSLGIGYLLNFARFDISFSTHESLGITSSASVIFQFSHQ